MSERLRLVIDRETWLRGNVEASRLRNDRGKRCCLGFLVEACGIRPSVTLNVASPGLLLPGDGYATLSHPRLAWTVKGVRGVGIWGSSEECCSLMMVNDDASLSEARREKFVAETMAGHGIDVVFVDSAEDRQ